MRIPLTLALSAALATFSVSACDREPGPRQGPASAGPATPPPAKVELVVAGSGDLDDRWSFLGRVEPVSSASLAPAAEGHVTAVHVREGDRVKRGQALVVLDAALIRAELDASRAREAQLDAEHAQAVRDAERAAKISGPAISEPERERLQTRAKTLEAQKAAQKAETQRVQALFTRHTLRAPWDGVVRARLVDPGAWASTGQPVIELVATDELEVLVEVSAALAPHLAEGKPATLVDPDQGGRAAAEVAGVVPALDPTTRTLRARLRPTERPPWLLPGMAINVEFPVAWSGGGVTVPRDALVRGPVSVRVIKAAGDVAVPIEVEVIATTADRVLVRGDGLSAGDSVVVRGNDRVRPGQTLRAADPEGK